jgi:hypothetical protein
MSDVQSSDVGDWHYSNRAELNQPNYPGMEDAVVPYANVPPIPST